MKYSASAFMSDPDGDTLTYKWEIKKESTSTKTGGDTEKVPPTIQGLIEDPTQFEIMVMAPEEEGAYRLFVYAFDGNGNAAHANVPFFVNK
jgi:hypothetical protein